jgi:hypothetical protein
MTNKGKKQGKEKKTNNITIMARVIIYFCVICMIMSCKKRREENPSSSIVDPTLHVFMANKLKEQLGGQTRFNDSILTDAIVSVERKTNIKNALHLIDVDSANYYVVVGYSENDTCTNYLLTKYGLYYLNPIKIDK